MNELLTNAVRHGGGVGHLRLWRDDGHVSCLVTDRGEGIPEDTSYERPPHSDPGGRGLWLAAELTDAIEVTSGQHGTAVRISTRVG